MTTDPTSLGSAADDWQYTEETPKGVMLTLSHYELHILRGALVREFGCYKTKTGKYLVEAKPIKELLEKLGG